MPLWTIAIVEAVDSTDAHNPLATATPAPTTAPTDRDNPRDDSAIEHHANELPGGGDVISRRTLSRLATESFTTVLLADACRV
jgi:hypothetical protein